MTDAKFAALQRAHALGALSDDLYETARARLLEEIAATPAAAPAPAPTNREGDRAVAITALPTEVLSLVLSQLCLVRNIKGVKRTCRAFRDAAPAAEQAHRRVCFEHADVVKCVAAVGARRPHHHRIERQHRQGVARRRMRAHHPGAHRNCLCGGGAAGRSALRQRLGGRHRPHRRDRPPLLSL